MRPDEHKKKQRAQYKKKHGISGKKTTSKEKKETNEGKESTESQGNVDLAETDGRKFSRRNISSNWDRYEDLEQDTGEDEDNNENILRRGEDFSVLLQRSADPASQFRFQSEKDWDQETDGEPTQATSALEIDFGALASSLNCVPLHKRLDISQDEIHPDIIEVFKLKAQACSKDRCTSPSSKDDAMTKCLTSSARNSHENPSQYAELQALPTKKKTVKDLPKRPIQQTDSESGKFSTGSLNGYSEGSLLSKHSGFTSEPGSLKNTKKLQSSLKDVLKTVNTTDSPQTGRTEQVIKSSNNEEDDDLDFLLSLDTPGGNSCNERMSFTVGETKKLDTSSDKGSSPTTNSSADQFTKEREDDLEDWLDSVLG